MKIVYAGSPAFAVEPLKALLSSGASVVAVITQPDRPVGRKKTLTPTPVKSFAIANGLNVFDFPKIRDHVAELVALGADIMITCAYGQILPEDLLAVFGGGVWNLHASLLPKFRGASPIQAAILAGEEYTGITVMKTEPELDSGDILLVKRCKTGKMTCGQLGEKLSSLAAEAAVEAVELISAGNVQLLMQDSASVSYCRKIKKEDCEIDFSAPAAEAVRKIKAFSPEPAAYSRLNGAALNILDAEEVIGSGAAGEVLRAGGGEIVVACGKNAIRIDILQLAGGKIMGAKDFLNGRKIKVGDILG